MTLYAYGFPISRGGVEIDDGKPFFHGDLLDGGDHRIPDGEAAVPFRAMPLSKPQPGTDGLTEELLVAYHAAMGFTSKIWGLGEMEEKVSIMAL